jgi:AP endonuclease 1
MPGSTTYKASAASAALTSPSSLDTKSNGVASARPKRVLDEAAVEADEDVPSPLRRSKRFKTNGVRKTNGTRVDSRSHEGIQVTSKKAANDKKITLNGTASKKVRNKTNNRKQNLKVPVEEDEIVKEEVPIKVAEDLAASLTEKGTPGKKKKAKEGKEMEAIPLTARTQGLRMFVGAHVSAAKGVHNSIINSTHIGLVPFPPPPLLERTSR